MKKDLQFQVTNSSIKKISKTSQYTVIHKTISTKLHNIYQSSSLNTLDDQLWKPWSLNDQTLDRFTNQTDVIRSIKSSYPTSTTCYEVSFPPRLAKARARFPPRSIVLLRRGFPVSILILYVSQARNYWYRSCLEVRYVGSPPGPTTRTLSSAQGLCVMLVIPTLSVLAARRCVGGSVKTRPSEI